MANVPANLPTPAVPAANYVPFVVAGNTVIISGQLPYMDGGIPCEGKVGGNVSVEDAKAIARQCGLNILAHLKSAVGGDWSRVARCARLGVFVNSAPGFTDQPQVANGVSDLMVEVFGKEIGSHARAAVGVAELPKNVAVEVEATFIIK